MQGLAYTDLRSGRKAEGSPGAGVYCRDVTAARSAAG